MTLRKLSSEVLAMASSKLSSFLYCADEDLLVPLERELGLRWQSSKTKAMIFFLLRNTKYPTIHNFWARKFKLLLEIFEDFRMV